MPTSRLAPQPPSEDDGTAYLVTQAAAPPSGRYLPGSVLSGKYRLDTLLGEGGMGSVWRATNLHLELPVAIKLIRADLDRGALRARLQLEARSAAKLGHPAIVRVFDVGESEFGDPFIVMELLEGETLARMLTRGRLSGAHAVQLLLPIIDALSMAHARGIVHRDLKPDNVMIALEDQHIHPKILDFGIAKLLDPAASDHKLTEAGAVVGSPDYMSPEQARGREDLSAATDIWSLSVVLYEAVTGNAPFSATNYNALLRAIVEDAPQSIVEQAAGDEALWAILQRGLAKDRRDRYQSMLELGQALAGWLLSHGVREDAAGTSVESKWLTRSDPAGLSPRSASAPALALAGEAKPESGATGMARGPFTHTILPRTSQRTRQRAFGALALGGGLVGALALALALRAQPQKPALVEAPRADAASANLASVVTAMQPAPVATVEPLAPSAPAPEAKANDAVPVVESVGPAPAPSAHSAAPAPNAPRPQPALHASAPIASAATSSKPVASSKPPAVASAAPAPAKPGDRPLDLLAPY